MRQSGQRGWDFLSPAATLMWDESDDAYTFLNVVVGIYLLYEWACAI